MYLKRLSSVCLALGTLMTGTLARANTFTFTASLNGASEVPANLSPATGFATITVDDSLNLLTINLSFTGLTGGPATMAHIHCCAPPGLNAGVVLPFAGFPSMTSGTYTHVFDLTTALTGITEANFLTGLESGLAYTNIHDAVYPGGEIRGQVLATPVPEPGSLLLFSTGALGAALLLRRRVDRVAAASTAGESKG